MNPLPYDGPALVHLGYVKTATTYLQRHLFRDADQGFALPGASQSRGHIVERLIVCDPFTFDAPATADHLAGLEAPERARGLIPVWSEEVLLGDPIAGRYDGVANLNRLAATMPGAKMLITIREQCAMALSIYREIIKSGGTLRLIDVIGTGQEAPAFRPHLRPEFLAFDRAVGFVQDRFGADNVLVLPQEMLRTAPKDYFDRLGRFLGREVRPPTAPGGDNSGRGALALALNRRINHVVRRSPLRRETGLGWAIKDRAVRATDQILPGALTAWGEGRLRTHVTHRYEGAFAESNSRLMELTGLPLDRMGYQHG